MLIAAAAAVVRDVGPYGHHGTVVGASIILALAKEECTSPMEQLRKQTQYALCCLDADVISSHSGSGSGSGSKKETNKKKKSKKKVKKKVQRMWQ